MSVKKNFQTNDFILIEDFAVDCRLGVTPEEQAHSQKISLTLWLWADLRRAGKSDRLEDTLDYASVIGGIRTLLASSQPISLIESVAEKAAEWILAHYPVNEVQVKAMKKPFPDVHSVGVVIRRRRSSIDQKKKRK